MHHRYDTANIPIELLRTLVTIADCGSFTKAGGILHLTQSAVSAQMKRLQQIVGGELFHKAAMGHGLTEGALRIADIGRRIIGMNDQILMRSGIRPFAPVSRVGVPTVFAQNILPQLIARCVGDDAGSGGVQFCSDTAPELLKRLNSGYIDVAVLLEARVGPDQTVNAWEEPAVWVCAKGFVLSPGAPIPIVTWEHRLADRMALNALDAAGLNYAPAFVSPDFAACLAAVRARLGFLVLPKITVPSDLKIARDYYLPPLPPISIGIYVREKKEKLKLLINQISAVIADHRAQHETHMHRPVESAPAKWPMRRPRPPVQNGMSSHGGHD